MAAGTGSRQENASCCRRMGSDRCPWWRDQARLRSPQVAESPACALDGRSKGWYVLRLGSRPSWLLNEGRFYALARDAFAGLRV